MYTKTTLSNGLRVVTCRMPRAQGTAIGIWIKVGGRYETEQNKGISHYLEHLLFKGSRKYSCRKLKEAIEGVGGSLNGFTSEEVTCFLAKLPIRYLPLAIDVLSDMVMHPLLPAQEVEKERTVILEEVKMYKDLPQHYVYDLLDGLMWPKQPIGLSIIGTAESVGSITCNDLTVYQRSHYTAANIVVSAAGDLSHRQLCRRLESIFCRHKTGNVYAVQPAREIQDKPNLFIYDKGTEQTHLALGFHSFQRDHPLKHAVSLLHIILGGNMSSRLFEQIREKRGLAYEIGVNVKRFSDTGAFIVHAGIDNSKVVEAVKLIMTELAKPKQGLVSPGEFKRAKEFYLGQLMLALDDVMDVMLWTGETAVMLDRIITLQEIIREVGRVTRDDIRKVARMILLKERLNVAIIGPLEKSHAQIYRQLSL